MRRFVSHRLPFQAEHRLLQAVRCGRSGARPCITRQFVVAIFVLLTLVVIHSSAPGQLSTKRPVIGVLSPFIDVDSTFLKDLRDGLSDLGLREGRDIAIEYRSAEGRIDQLPVLAEELVRLKVDIVVTASAPAIRSVQQATRTIPIVMARVGDAVDQGFVASLARPGGNITGISWLAPELSAKRLELMKDAFPGIVRVGILREASAGAASVIAVQAAARKLGVVPSVFEVRGPDEFQTAFSAMSDARVEGVEILEGPMIFNTGLRYRIGTNALAPRNIALFRQLFSVLASRNVLPRGVGLS